MSKLGSYYTVIKSANPHPVCRKGGCPTLAADGSEWCSEHEMTVKVNQAWAEEQRHSLTRSARTESHSTFGHGSPPLAGS